jgi:hypothetical protein
MILRHTMTEVVGRCKSVFRFGFALFSSSSPPAYRPGIVSCDPESIAIHQTKSHLRFFIATFCRLTDSGKPKLRFLHILLNAPTLLVHFSQEKLRVGMAEFSRIAVMYRRVRKLLSSFTLKALLKFGFCINSFRGFKIADASRIRALPPCLLAVAAAGDRRSSR